MTLEEINNLEKKLVFNELFKCCGSTTWAHELSNKRPYINLDDLFTKSDVIWSKVKREDVLEAFSHHPKIGDVSELEKKFAATKEWAGNEQASVSLATKSTIEALAKGNDVYEKKFGFIFIVCATGKTAEEMLNMLNLRISNDLDSELIIAKNEQNKITKIRLSKLLTF
jgi:2-oxo-4-hydroxy-4-carboxy-5-ureidoimidazoline decarboxylase